MPDQSDQPDNIQPSANGGVSPTPIVPPSDDVLSGVAEVTDNNPPPSDPLPTASLGDSSQSSEPTSELAEIKKQALEKLSPLVERLDQAPEEKFKTIMMMIQSTDNQSLIKEAYQAAQNISDEQEKAKALLAVINEVDYFAQKDN